MSHPVGGWLVRVEPIGKQIGKQPVHDRRLKGPHDPEAGLPP